MIIKEKIKLDFGLLFQGDRLIGIFDGGNIEQEYFVPDRFMNEPVHDEEEDENDV